MNEQRYELDRCISDSARRLRASEKTLRQAANPNLERIITERIHMDIQAPPDRVVEIAESYHALFANNKAQRMSELRQMYTDLGQPGDLITMVYCQKFVPLFENWLASCEANGIPVRHRLMVFTLDEEAYRRSNELGIKSLFLDPRMYGQAGGSDGFGDKQFSRTMFYKNAIIHDLLELGANVLFQDVDLIWLKDPFKYLTAADAQEDLYIMYDGPNRLHRPLHANTGFIYVKCKEACKAFFETALGNTSAIFTCRSHQKPFNWILEHFQRHNVLAIKVLPQSQFANGHLFNLKRGVLPKAKEWRSDSYVVHYSWTGTMKEKREKIKKFGFNYLPMERLSGALTES